MRGAPSKIEILETPPDSDFVPHGRFTIYKSATGGFEVGSVGDRTPFWVDYRSDDEAGIVEYVWQLISKDFIGLWVDRNPANDLFQLKVLKTLDGAKSKAALGTSVADLVQLSRDASAMTRQQVAINPATPEAVLEQFVDDERVAPCLPYNPAISVEMLQELSLHSSRFVRERVAGREGLPVSLLERLAKDPLLPVVRGVAANPTAPTELVDSLAEHDSFDVRWAASGNPALSRSKLASLIPKADFGMRWFIARKQEIEVPIAWISEDKWVAQSILMNKEASPERLREVARWTGFAPRVVGHPNASRELVVAVVNEYPQEIANFVLRAEQLDQEFFDLFFSRRDDWIDSLLHEKLTARYIKTPYEWSERSRSAIRALDDARFKLLVALDSHEPKERLVELAAQLGSDIQTAVGRFRWPSA
jgi:hypothetical protein